MCGRAAGASIAPAALSVMVRPGIDIIEIERVRQALARRPGMAVRLFTERERSYCDAKADPAPHYAARFAAKEATAKAVGRSLRWREVEIAHDREGRPLLLLHGEAAALAGVSAGAQASVSLSHSRHYAVACVLLFSPQEIASRGENLPPGSARA